VISFWRGETRGKENPILFLMNCWEGGGGLFIKREKEKEEGASHLPVGGKGERKRRGIGPSIIIFSFSGGTKKGKGREASRQERESCSTQPPRKKNSGEKKKKEKRGELGHAGCVRA